MCTASVQVMSPEDSVRHPRVRVTYSCGMLGTEPESFTRLESGAKSLSLQYF